MNTQKRCIVIAAGQFYNEVITVTEHDYVIAVDGGFAYLERLGITASAVVGDFDSLGYIPEHENISVYQSEKDDTDMMLAIKLGTMQGCKEFHLYFGMGGRFDHTIANLQTLTYITKYQDDNGQRLLSGYLYDEHNMMTVICDGSISFSQDCKGYVSCFSLDEYAYGVDEVGLKYGLDKATLQNSFPLGVSNEFIGKPASISVIKGTLLITQQRNII